jgi:plasmid stabilization system protein ParE
MRVEYTAAARREFSEAAEFYAAERPELGDEFCKEVQRTIGRIIELPDAWTAVGRYTRRCRTKRFPYGIIYQVRGDLLLIIGVMHLHRSPRVWKSRLPKNRR